jgi:hypothetical protein
MKMPRHRALIRRMWLARLKRLTARGPILAASLVWNGKRCGRPGCRCARGDKHMAWYLTYKERAKTRTVYVPVDLVKEVRRWIEEHRRLKLLSQEISALSIEMVRTHVRDRRRRAGRC